MGKPEQGRSYLYCAKRFSGQKKAGAVSRSGPSAEAKAYLAAELKLLETLLKVPVKLVLTAFIAVIEATAIRAAIRPYSMAVAPLLFFRKLRIFIISIYSSRNLPPKLPDLAQACPPGQRHLV